MSNTTALALALLVGALVGGVIASSLKPAPAPDPSLDPATATSTPTPAEEAALRTEVMAPTPVPDAPAVPVLTSADLSDAEARRAALRQEVLGLQAQLDAHEASARDTAAARAATTPPTFSFGIPEDAPAFANADWKKLGQHATKLTALLRELRESLVQGEQPSPATQTRIQRENTPLAMFTVKLAGEVEDLTPNGAFVHPAVTANLARAMLEEAGLPLTADQESALDALGSAAALSIERALSGFAATTPAIGQTALITDQRLQFVDSLRGVLTAEQDAFLFPPETAGRLKLDLLSPVLVYITAAPVEARDRAALATSLVQRVLTIAGTPREDVSSLAWIGERWVDAIPGVLEPIDLKNAEIYFPHVDVCQTRAHAEAAAIVRLIETGTFSEEEVAKLRAVNALLYPYIRRS